MKTIAILGGGIGGLCTAIALQKKGFQVNIYESAPVLKALGAGLGLAANAVKALTDLGMGEELLQAGAVLTSFEILAENGKLITKTNSLEVSKKFGTDNVTIHRADLHHLLVQQLQPHTLVLGKACKDFEQSSTGVRIFFKDGSEAKGDYLIAADGIHSVVRKKLVPGSVPRYAGYTCWRAVIEGQPEGFHKQKATETWGSKGRFGIVPLSQNRIYWFACKNAPYQDTHYAKFTTKELSDNFKDYHQPIPNILAMTTDEQLIWNDIIDIKPIKQFAFGKVLLCGDAAHATTPNMGQGACQAIEDAVILANCMSVYATDLEKAFQVFEQKRISRTTRIVNTSWQLGKVAQLENKLLLSLRNTLLRLVPASANNKQLQFLYAIDFANV
ncbi:FAD-dependent monooxygenase [Rhodocytophaga aerolata]|uniref:FAD-dependent monooxygenase n=1 Tax=Rhodocytophaga aerolata TaxID=455078 RepID=A0ABT8RAF1_9BACT|nr:FAD-dependent monooxygenase [Rhodocytophaga aerolata]MDO1449087.1 FAD-dependent monooxygenase [Rhodocytophaga aerolata]